MTKWIITERTTIESAARALAARTGDLPIYVRVTRKDRDTKAGGWDAPSYHTVCTLEAVTPKRLKVSERHGGVTFYAAPNKCYFTEQQEVT